MSENVTPSPAGHAKRLRVFAGPNGSGKSSICRAIAAQYNVGTYVNVDHLLFKLMSQQGLSLQGLHASLNSEAFRDFYVGHPLRLSFGADFPFIVSDEGHVSLSEPARNSQKVAYAISVLADYVRTRLIEASEDLSFETVLCHPSKLELIRKAKEKGYHVYLYYVCVASPVISKQRVAIRINQGGIGVPENKIAERYERSLALLKDAVALSDKAYLFDNTYSGASLKLEITQASKVTPHETQLPEWMTRSLLPLVACE